MPEVHLRQSGFTYSPCGLFTKNKKKNKKMKTKTKKLRRFKRYLSKQIR